MLSWKQYGVSLAQTFGSMRWSLKGTDRRRVVELHESINLLPERVHAWRKVEYPGKSLRWIGSTDPPLLSSQGVAVGLYITLGTFTETFEFWWRVFTQELHTRSITCAREPAIASNDNVQLYAQRPFQPYTMRWVQIRIDMGRRSSVAQARTETTGRFLSGPELVAVMAQHPNFIRTRDGRRNPYVRMGAIDVSGGSIPTLRYNAQDSCVVLGTHPLDFRDINQQFANTVTFPTWGMLR